MKNHRLISKSILIPAFILALYFLPLATALARTDAVASVEAPFLAGNYEQAAAEAERMINSRSGNRDELYYLKGLSELKLKRYDRARESFEYITSRYSRSQKAFDARIGIGDSYMLAGDPAKAAEVYNGILNDRKADKNPSIVYSRLASCYSAMGIRTKADYYGDMAKRAAPMSFEAKGESVAAIAPKQYVKAPVTKAAPVSGIRQREPEEMDVMMAAAFSVQVGSFKNRRNAERLARKLASSGFESRIEIPVKKYDNMYRVKVGRPASRVEAEALEARLKASGYTTKICDGEECR